MPRRFGGVKEAMALRWERLLFWSAHARSNHGRRKTKTVNGTTTVFVTDADNREVLEYDGTSGAIQRWYAYALGPNDVLNQMNVTAGTRATLFPDILGSIIASQDSSSGALPDGQNSCGQFCAILSFVTTDATSASHEFRPA
jgi:hypothetical protein